MVFPDSFIDALAPCAVNLESRDPTCALQKRVTYNKRGGELKPGVYVAG